MKMESKRTATRRYDIHLEWIPPGHPALKTLDQTSSMVDILEAISKWLGCSIVVSNGLWHFIPNGTKPSPEFLATELEVAKRLLQEKRKARRAKA